MNEIGASGLDSRLVEAAHAAGFERLTPVQAAALPVLRRGGNVVLHASSGAGVTAAYALPLLDRLTQSAGEGARPRALVLTPGADRAEALAAAIGTLGGSAGVAVRAAAPGWRTDDADVLVASPDRALAAVQDSALKLEAVQTIVLTDLASLLALFGSDALNTVVALVPRDAQRVITSAELDAATESFIDAHARRALTVPPRPADPAAARQQEPIGQIGYVVLAEAEKSEMLARLLDGVEDGALVWTRTAARAEQVQRELGRRGITASGATVRVAAFASTAEPSERVVSYDVPFSADELRRLHEAGGTVFVTPAELPHFRRIAAEVPFTAKQRRAKAVTTDALDAFRDSIRAALQTEDLAAQLLVLGPLFDEHSPAEVAAAVSALLRRRTPPKPAASAAAPEGVPKEAGTAGLTRLFISIGARDNVRPGDLVGAITGEAGIRGEQVGRVDIRDTFSVVEVAAAAAERVIRALNGTTMRGRSLRVDYDRKGAAEGGSRAGAGPRRARPAAGSPRRRPT